MKLYDKPLASIQESSELEVTSSFKMANTPHMFRILSSGLYADKISAVIREIACNAHDAHIMADTPNRAIEVKLPTSMDKTFYVKDWGPGLGDTEVRELYTTYGWSSKQQNEETTGGFGLGSKSPFAYTTSNEEESDGFTVVSVKDGMKRVYTCYLTEASEPAISRMMEAPADDPDWQHGMMVTFPVQGKDIAEFHEKAAEIFRWFAVTPNVLGLNTGKIVAPEYEIKGTGYGIGLKNPSGYRNTHSYVIMGGVRYPIEADKLKDLKKIQRDLLIAGIDLFLPNGSVLMQPSREGLQYTSRTTNAILTALDKVLAELGNGLKTIFEDKSLLPWPWLKKMTLAKQTLKKASLEYYFTELLIQAGVPETEVAKYGKLLVSGMVQIPASVGEGPSEDPRVDHSRVWIYRKSGGEIIKGEVVRGYLGANTTSPSTAHLDCTAETVVLHVDCKHADARVKDFLRANDVSVALLVSHGRVGKITGFPVAKTYAESIGNTDDLKGIPVLALATATADFEAIKKQRQARVILPAAERYASELVKVCTAANGAYPSDETLGSIVDECDKYYILSTNLDRLTRGTISNDGFAKNVSGYSVDTQLQAIRAVTAYLGCPVNKILVLRAEGTARRLKLQDQGFKPLLPHVYNLLKDPTNHEKFEELKGALKQPAVRFNLREMYIADDFELRGIAAHYKLTNSAQWKEISSVFAGTEFLKVIDDFIDAVSSTAAAAQPPALVAQQKVLSALGSLTWLYPVPILENQKAPTSSHEVKENIVKDFAKAYPLTSGFKVDFLIKNMGNKSFLELLKQAMITDKLISKHVPAFAGLSKWSAS